MATDRTKGEVWVFAEQEDGKLSDVPRELLGKGRELADRLGVTLAAVLMGDGVEGLAKPLFEAGADKVHLVEDPELKMFRGKAYRHAFAVSPHLSAEATAGARSRPMCVAPKITIWGLTSLISSTNAWR